MTRADDRLRGPVRCSPPSAAALLRCPRTPRRRRSESGDAFLLLAVLVHAACASAPTPAPAGALRVACTPDDAEVYLDDGLAGTCGSLRARPLPKAVGTRRVEIRRPGFFTRYVEVPIAAGRTAEVRVELRAAPEP